MKKKIILILIPVITLGIIYWYYRVEIQDHFIKDHVIFWSENVELKPSDFQAEIDWGSEINEWWYHSLYLKSTNFKDAEVKAIFDQSKSWIKDTTNFKELMKTQKLRFDLFESYARKFNYEIDKIKHKDNGSFKDLEKIGDKIYADLLKVEDSIMNTDLTQEELIKFWQPKINKRLEKYEYWGFHE